MLRLAKHHVYDLIQNVLSPCYVPFYNFFGLIEVS